MVSSLPFLAPIFVRKAKEYRSKHSNDYASSSDDQKQSKPFNYGREKGHISSASEEQIVSKDRIVKSMTYRVEVEDEQKGMKTIYTE
jgi:hypothetical protein